jgi:two-component system phosphate regulon response regulator PhoB
VGPIRTVLLVEDEADLRELLAFALRRRGYRVTPAGDAVAAARALADQVPDLAVVDMMLPGPSGFSVIDQVKARSDGRVPVIMISGNAAAAHRDFALAAGADTFLPKPFALSALVQAAEALCPVPLPGAGARPFPRVALARS